jgi:hypothetical protein
MKVKIMLEVEVEVKDRYEKMELTETSGGGGFFEHVWAQPTDADIRTYVTESLKSARDSGRRENKFAPCYLTDFSIIETTFHP